jgi:hypothetical protein
MQCPSCGLDIPPGATVCPGCGRLLSEKAAGGPISPGMPGVPQKGWLGRNWKWVVPVGCFGFIVLIFAFVALILAVVFGSMKNEEIYKQSVAKARAHPAVVQKLGTPIEEGWMFTGSFNVTPEHGEAKIGIPISGPRGKGTIHVDAVKQAGEWQYNILEVEIEGEPERINLLEEIPGVQEQ